MSRALLCLVGMFKDEADNVRALLESATPHVDTWCITDTGSTDDTMEEISHTMGELRLPGKLFEEKPILAPLKKRQLSVFDFAANRNRVLDLSENLFTWRPVFTLFLSGHETLQVDGDALRTFLDKQVDALDGAYCVEMRAGTRSWPYTRVLRVDAGWRYHGKIHECPIGPHGENKGPTIPGVMIVHKPPAEEYKRKIQRLREHDLPTLEDIVDDESLPLEARAGSMLFLAETHAQLAADCKKRDGDKISQGGPWLTHQVTAMSLYWRYAQIGQQPDKPGYDPQKVHYALALYYSLAGEVPGLYTPEEMVHRLEMLVIAAPKLPEARFLLAKYASQSDPKTGPRLGLYYATEAAKVARAARLEPTYEVTETTLEWRSLLLASACADRLREVAKSMEERTKKAEQAHSLLEAAIAAGAPKELRERVA